MKGEISNVEQIAYTRLVVDEYGERLLLVKCGLLSLTLLVDRCLDIYDLSFEGVNMAYLSKMGRAVDTSLPFAKRFEGGFLYTCGLNNIANPDMGEPLHGRIHCQKSKLISHEVIEENDNFSVIVDAIIGEAELFGKNLSIRRRYIITNNAIKIHDAVTNLGYQSEEYMQLYHFNTGYPMLDKGVTIDINSDEVTPRNNESQNRQADRRVFLAPENIPEVVYGHKKTSGNFVAKISNAMLSKSIKFTFSSNSLPYLFQWKSERGGDYALGIEPSTTHLDDKKFSILEPKQTDEHDILIEFLLD